MAHSSLISWLITWTHAQPVDPEMWTFRLNARCKPDLMRLSLARGPWTVECWLWASIYGTDNPIRRLWILNLSSKSLHSATWCLIWQRFWTLFTSRFAKSRCKQAKLSIIGSYKGAHIWGWRMWAWYRALNFKLCFFEAPRATRHVLQSSISVPKFPI